MLWPLLTGLFCCFVFFIYIYDRIFPFDNINKFCTFSLLLTCVTGHKETLPARSGVGDWEHGRPPERLHVQRANGVLRQSLLKGSPTGYGRAETLFRLNSCRGEAMTMIAEMKRFRGRESLNKSVPVQQRLKVKSALEHLNHTHYEPAIDSFCVSPSQHKVVGLLSKFPLCKNIYCTWEIRSIAYTVN